MRCAHYAVDYLAAAVGGDPVEGGAVVRGGGIVGEGVDRKIHIVLEGRLETVECVCLVLVMTGSGWNLHMER